MSEQDGTKPKRQVPKPSQDTMQMSIGAEGHKLARRSRRPALAAALLPFALLFLIYSRFGPPPPAVLLAAAGPTQLVATAARPASAAGPTLPSSHEPKGIFKRSFAGLGCLGIYDKAKFARLDRVCEECYTLYREPDIHTACRQDCFRNSVFTRCVDALLLSHEAKKFDEMVDELYGK